MRTDYTITDEKDRDELEAARMKDGWECVYRSGIDPAGTNIFPPRLLHVWHKRA